MSVQVILVVNILCFYEYLNEELRYRDLIYINLKLLAWQICNMKKEFLKKSIIQPFFLIGQASFYLLGFKLLFFFLEDCVWGPWSTWLSCSKTCGGGTTYRSRIKTKIEQFGGTCSGSGSESKSCNTQSCPGT